MRSALATAPLALALISRLFASATLEISTSTSPTRASRRQALHFSAAEQALSEDEFQALKKLVAKTNPEFARTHFRFG